MRKCFDANRFSSLSRWMFGWILALLVWGTTADAARYTTVIIDAGHGGKDKGAYWGGIRESHLTLATAQRLERLLKKKGMKTVMTRRSDVFVSLASRAAIANRYRNSVFVSIHYNAHRNTRFRGVETYCWGATGMKLAGAIQRRLPSRLGTRNRGVKRRQLTVLMKTKMPAVLVECGFLSNPTERGRCRGASYQQTVAQAICDGIMVVR
ncbi:N-acetylmuramoyl-L-alanine amidase [Luteolibacter marinus]|uniref:N-acetylmuramoyl-L-alanine amidase n=1 Tax=Luteolibacter marinus TaxID=2776705 RepID=UPI0031BB2E24